MTLCDFILTNLDSVVRVHTDGLICKNPITNVKLGKDIGNLKFEGSAKCIILNANSYIWEDEQISILKQCLLTKMTYDETYKLFHKL